MLRQGLATAAMAAALLAGGTAAAQTSFIGSIWYPQTHPLDRFGYEIWAEKVKERSNGELEPNIFYGTALLPPQAHLSGLQDGIAQLTHHAGTYTPAELPEDSVISMLAMGFDDTFATAMAMSDFGLNDPAMQARYEELGIVFAGGFSTPQYILMCKEPIKSLEDIKGVKIRTPGAVQADWARSVGAVPVTVPSTEMYTGLEKGQLDCASNASNDLKSRSLWDVAKHTNLISLGLYFHGWQYAFNKDFWSGLSTEHRRILLDTIAEAIPETAVGYLAESAAALEEAPGKGVTIHEAAPDVQQSVFDFAASTGRETAIQVGTERFGIDDPAGLVDRFLATYDKWEGLLDGVDRTDAAALTAIIKENLYDNVDAATYGVN
ncbi:MAG: C4-dicarboxylate TRAP transporter substrate-binding protein [Pseudomonadota bacterium]